MAGIGNSAVFPAISALVVQGSPPAQLGAASGLNAAARELGAVLGVALVAIAFSTAGNFTDMRTVASGLAAAMLLCALAAAAAAAAASVITLTLPQAPVRTG